MRQHWVEVAEWFKAVLLGGIRNQIYRMLLVFERRGFKHQPKLIFDAGNGTKQRWSPRGRPGQILKILKSLALASRPQVLENWPVLGSRTAVFFELLKFCGALENFFGKRFFVEIA